MEIMKQDQQLMVSSTPTNVPETLTIRFPYNGYVPEKEFETMLKDTVHGLQAARGLQFIIEGHTDQIGGRAFNYKLGMVRALFIKKFLETHNVPGSITAPVISYGKDRLLCSELTEACMKKNRWVIIHVLNSPEAH